MAALVRGQGDEGGAGARDERHEQAPCGRQSTPITLLTPRTAPPTRSDGSRRATTDSPTPTLIAPPNAVWKFQMLVAAVTPARVYGSHGSGAPTIWSAAITTTPTNSAPTR